MQIPTNYQALLDLSPEQVQELCDEFLERQLDSTTIEQWLQDWAVLAALFQECMARFDIATSVNTADETAQERQKQHRETISPIEQKTYQRVSQRLESHADLLPSILRETMARQKSASKLNQSQAAMDLLNRQMELNNQYETMRGAQTFEWNGETLSARQLQSVLREEGRDQREKAWRMLQSRFKQDYEAINHIWTELIDVRVKLAQENGFDNYLDYRWAEIGRTDYTPQDSQNLHAAVLEHWSPLYAKIIDERKSVLQLSSLRPWDTYAPLSTRILRPFATTDELLQKTIKIFGRMDAEFAAYVEKLNGMGFIDLSERTHTGSMGGFSRAIGRHGNFIFLNVQRTHEDVVNLVHEIGHALALYEACKLPYLYLWFFPSDFIETPSTVMEMLTQPYWDEFYNAEDLQLAKTEYFQTTVEANLFECAADAFQHWIYQNPDVSRNPTECGKKWDDLMQQYLPGVNNDGLEEFDGLGWQQMGLIFHAPFYIMEYFYGRIVGLKLLGLLQEEANKLYKAAIALGGSVSTKALFAAFGVEFPITTEDVIATKQQIIKQLNISL